MGQSPTSDTTIPDVPRESRRWIFNPYVLLVMRLVLAAVFIYAAVQKIGHPLEFADEIRMYRILDIGPPLYIVSIVLPWVELFCGIALVTGIFLRGSALILAAFNIVFLIAVSIRTAQVMSEESIGFMKVYFDCGCGFGETYAWKKLLEDIVFLVFSCVLLAAPAYRFVLQRARR
jgi:uncharacterized membrane protein YphA (DoxX/SURF4 family)